MTKTKKELKSLEMREGFLTLEEKVVSVKAIGMPFTIECTRWYLKEEIQKFLDNALEDREFLKGIKYREKLGTKVDDLKKVNSYLIGTPPPQNYGRLTTIYPIQFYKIISKK